MNETACVSSLSHFLKAISDLIDVKLTEQEKRIDKRLDDLRTEFKEMIIANNMLTLQQIQRIESEKISSPDICELKLATLQNCFDIAVLKNKVS